MDAKCNVPCACCTSLSISFFRRLVSGRCTSPVLAKQEYASGSMFSRKCTSMANYNENNLESSVAALLLTRQRKAIRTNAIVCNVEPIPKWLHIRFGNAANFGLWRVWGSALTFEWEWIEWKEMSRDNRTTVERKYYRIESQSAHFRSILMSFRVDWGQWTAERTELNVHRPLAK